MLTEFQMMRLRELAKDIAEGRECYLGVDPMLSKGERNYLVEVLRTKHRIAIK